MIRQKLGNRIRLLRIERNISQEKFALSIDMDRTYFASVENGKRNISIRNTSVSKTIVPSGRKIFRSFH